MILKKIYHSAILNSWFSSLVILLSSLVAIPIVITKLTVEEANVWFIFYSVVSLGQSVLFGFNGTFTRFIAYSYSGVPIKQFSSIRKISNKSSQQEINKEELSEIFFLMRTIYIFLSLIFLLFLIVGGYLGISKPISEMINPNEGWQSWYVVVGSTSAILVLGYFRVFLEGINQVAMVQRLLGIINAIGFGFILIVLTYYPTLFHITLIYQLITLLSALALVFPAVYYMNKLELKNSGSIFNLSLFRLVWGSAWKSGITVIIANTIKHLSAILVAQWYSPYQSASFQFTKRLFDVIENFTMITFQSKIPVFAKLRAKGDLTGLKKNLRKTQWISYAVFLFGYLVILYFGDVFVALIDSNIELASAELVVLFSLSTFIARWGGMTLLISNQANYVVEHINAIIVSSVYFLFLWLGFEFYGVNVFPLGLLVALLVSSPIIALQVYPTIRTSFSEYERYALWPAFVVLLFINGIYLALG